MTSTAAWHPSNVLHYFYHSTKEPCTRVFIFFCVRVKTGLSFPRKNINFRNFENCWREYILSKRGSKMGLEELHIIRNFITHILLILLVWLTMQIWYGHAAHVEKGEMDTMFWSEKLQGKNQLKIRFIFQYNSKTHFRETGRETAYWI